MNMSHDILDDTIESMITCRKIRSFYSLSVNLSGNESRSLII